MHYPDLVYSKVCLSFLDEVIVHGFELHEWLEYWPKKTSILETIQLTTKVVDKNTFYIIDYVIMEPSCYIMMVRTNLTSHWHEVLSKLAHQNYVFSHAKQR